MKPHSTLLPTLSHEKWKDLKILETQPPFNYECEKKPQLEIVRSWKISTSTSTSLPHKTHPETVAKRFGLPPRFFPETALK